MNTCWGRKQRKYLATLLRGAFAHTFVPHSFATCHPPRRADTALAAERGTVPSARLGPCWVALRIACPGRRSCLASACCAQQSQAHEVPTLSLSQARTRKQVNVCQINR